jgi:hypothetical protein
MRQGHSCATGFCPGVDKLGIYSSPEESSDFASNGRTKEELKMRPEQLLERSRCYKTCHVVWQIEVNTGAKASIADIRE